MTPNRLESMVFVVRNILTVIAVLSGVSDTEKTWPVYGNTRGLLVHGIGLPGTFSISKYNVHLYI